MSTTQSNSVDTLSFLPTLVLNLVPAFGIFVFDWRVLEVLAVYWVEMATSFVVYGGAAVFAQRPVVVEGRDVYLPGVSRNAERPEKWDQEPNPVELPGRLPPLYPRNLRLVSMSLIWGFWFLTFPLIKESFALVEEVLSPSLALAALAMMISQLVQLRREFFGKAQYEEMSPHMVLEIPGRLLLFAIVYISLVTVVGGGVLVYLLVLIQEATGIAVPNLDFWLWFATAMVLGKIAVEWSRFRAENEENPTGFATWLLPENPKKS